MKRPYLALLLAAGCAPRQTVQTDALSRPEASWAPAMSPLPGETRFEWIRKLTANVPGGTHARRTSRPTGGGSSSRRSARGTRPTRSIRSSSRRDASRGFPPGRERPTCAYYLRDGRFVYSSTHLQGDEPPPPPDRSKGYVWPLYRTFDLFRDDGEGRLVRLTDNDGYDAEATVSVDGKRIVFTSYRRAGSASGR